MPSAARGDFAPSLEEVATDASAAESAPSTQAPGIMRKLLSKMDGPVPGYVTIVTEVEVEPGVMVPRHSAAHDSGVI
jgi:hypothetical protein